MAMSTAEHVLVVGAAAVAAAVVAPVALPAAAAMVGATGIVAAVSGFTGVSLTAGGSGLLAGWFTHKALDNSGAASK